MQSQLALIPDHDGKNRHDTQRGLPWTDYSSSGLLAVINRHHFWSSLSFRPLSNLPEGLYILLALISFFFNDRSENNYLRMRWTDFRNLFTEWKHFRCKWSTWTSFSHISRDVAMATNLWKNDKLPTFVALAFRNGMGYRYLNVGINSVNDASKLHVEISRMVQ